MKCNPKVAGLTTGTTVAILYAVIALLYVMSPDQMANFMARAHMMTSLEMYTEYLDINLGSFIFGITVHFIFSFLIGYVFAMLYNYFSKKIK